MSQYPDGNITEQHHRGWDRRRRLKRPNRKFKGAENMSSSGKIIQTFSTFMQQFGCNVTEARNTLSTCIALRTVKALSGESFCFSCFCLHHETNIEANQQSLRSRTTPPLRLCRLLYILTYLDNDDLL